MGRFQGLDLHLAALEEQKSWIRLVLPWENSLRLLQALPSPSRPPTPFPASSGSISIGPYCEGLGIFGLPWSKGKLQEVYKQAEEHVKGGAHSVV